MANKKLKLEYFEDGESWESSWSNVGIKPHEESAAIEESLEVCICFGDMLVLSEASK